MTFIFGTVQVVLGPDGRLNYDYIINIVLTLWLAQGACLWHTHTLT